MTLTHGSLRRQRKDYSRRIKKARREFQQFLREHFPAPTELKGPTVLVEINSMSSSHVAYAYLANVIAEETSGLIKPFAARGSRRSWLPFVNGKLRPLFVGVWFIQSLRVYRSFGARGLVCPVPTRRERSEAGRIVSEFLKRNPDKRAFEKLEIRGVKIGDLLYDSYLRNYNVPTIDLNTRRLELMLRLSIEEALVWDRFFASANISAVLGSHAGYIAAIPLRFAMARQIPVFEPTIQRIFRLSQERPIDSDFLDFPAIFASFSDEQKEESRLLAKQRLERRFSGEVGVDMAYSTASAYTKVAPERLIENSSRPKVLIAAHCFFDNPHCYGDNLFPDFWEWLEFLGNFSQTVDYDWYIKTHPDVLPGNIEVLSEICSRYSTLKLLPSDASHHQIIEEGIDVALTVYGTIGFEYAYLGVPVINASERNPHIMYGFNFHPKSVSEYENLLRAIPNLTLGNSQDEVAEFYYMKNIYGSWNLFFDNWESSLNSLGGYTAQFSPVVFEEFLRGLSYLKHKQIKSELRAFFLSTDHRLYFQ